MTENLDYFLTILLQGVASTVGVALPGIALCTPVAFIAGMALIHRSRAVRFAARCYVEFWRGTSEVVQLFWIYFALPVLIGLQLVPLWAGVLVVGLNASAYGAEVVRGAMLSVNRAQYEACLALNLPRFQRTFRVILPQAIPEMIPPFTNLYIGLLKGTALVSLIGVQDITFQGSQILGTSYPGQTPAIYLLMLVLYFGLASVIIVGMRALERVVAKSLGVPIKHSRARGARRALAVSGEGQ